ncbi:MAG: rhamnogalacturonan lyase B N-terminal domain-containing protein [Massilia sp.]
MNQLKWRGVGAAMAVAALVSACGGSGPETSAAQAPSLLAVAGATSFGVTVASGLLTVDTGAGLVFKVKQAGGDISSIKYNNGPELQGASGKGTHISSGIGATVTYEVVGNVAKITLTTPTLVHYLLVREGENNIYMGTYVTAEPTVGELRWIARLRSSVLTNVPEESNNAGNNGAIESTDVFGLPNGETRSKYFGNQRAIDLTMRGVTGSGIGVFMAYGNRESSSGGPFYNDIQNQSGGDQEVYNYMNSGHNQTEPNRMGFHGPYAMLFTSGETPTAIPDMSWVGNYNLLGWVGADGRGVVHGAGLSGMTPGYAYTVGFANAAAQYWTKADAVTGEYTAPAMKAGTYTMTVYKHEYAVSTDTVTVAAGATTELASRDVAAKDPGNKVPLWRIGEWDGAPLGFVNSSRLRNMHPSDVRHSPWVQPDYYVGTSRPDTGFSPYQWKDVNGTITIKFKLKASQIAPLTVRAGITAVISGGRPKAQVNGWVSSNPAASSQPNSRSITLGSYRGNNAMYSFNVPASALVVGENTLSLTAISGSSGTAYLSPGYAYDAVDVIKTP